MGNIGIVNLLTIGFVVTGTICLFSSKMQNIQQVNEGGVYKHFFHPYMQTFLQFIGQSLSLLVYIYLKRKNPIKHGQEQIKALQQGKRLIPKYLIVLPSLCQLIATCLQYLSLNFIPASIYQMLKGIGIASTFGFSYLLIRDPIKKHEIIGAVLALIGVIIVGVSALIFTQSVVFTALDIVIGCIMMMTAMTIKGFQFSYEAKLMSTYYISPVQLLGIQGIFGAVFSWLLIVILMFVPCHLGQKACVFNSQGLPFMQRPEMFWYQVINSPLLIIMSIITMLSVAMFNLIGLTITKYINALARAILNLAQTTLVWVIGIIVTLTAGKHNKAYEWQLLDWKDLLTQGIGFTLLVLGTLIYNEMIKFGKKEGHRQLVQQVQTKDT